MLNGDSSYSFCTFQVLSPFPLLASVKLFRSCLAEHSQHAFFIGACQNLVVREPTDVVRFFAEGDLLIRLGNDEKSHVVMLVRVVKGRAVGTAAFRDKMDVEIEWHELALMRGEGEFQEPGFFLRFAMGHRGDVTFPIGVPAGLKPTIEFRVMHEQHPRAIVRQDPCRAGDMPGSAGALKAIGQTLHERANPVGDFALLRKSNDITV